MSNPMLPRLARPVFFGTTLTVSAVLSANFSAAAASSSPAEVATPAPIDQATATLPATVMVAQPTAPESVSAMLSANFSAAVAPSSPAQTSAPVDHLIATTPVPVMAATPTDLTGAALDQVTSYSDEGSGEVQGQVTSVSQLSDVKPTDWAFQALQSLVERYGCIVGYPDQTYRGNRALTRYEFAAGLNACLDRVNELMAATTADLVKKEDMVTLQKLQEEFAAELATLRGRVDSLEARTTTLEKQQFSTTTKLRGEAIFSISGALGDQKAVPTGAVPGSAGEVDQNTTFSDRVRLSLITSFMGPDTLLTRIQARNVPNFREATGTNMTRLSYEGGGPGDNAAFVDKLYYRFPLGKATVTLDAVGGEFNANVPNFNPLLASDGQGTISRFGRFNPIYRQGASGSGSGAGLTVNYPLSDALTVSLGYLADDASNPNNARGLFNGSNAALAQLAFKPSKEFEVGFTYVRSFDRGGNVGVTGATGSLNANAPFGAGVATSADHFGLEASYKFGTKVVISGWGGFTKARSEGLAVNQSADIFNWALALAFPDLGKKGNLAALIVGMPPKATNNDNAARQDSFVSLSAQ
jgi:Carbohydrate-selective porin, OprB family/S-layer homology domain